MAQKMSIPCSVIPRMMQILDFPVKAQQGFHLQLLVVELPIVIFNQLLLPTLSCIYLLNMSRCLPGMPCYETIVYKTYPKGYTTSEPSPFSLPLSSDDITYSGPNLPYTGIQTDTELTE